MDLEERQAMSKAQAELQALAREKAADVIAAWRAKGMSDAEIGKKLGRLLPRELRRR